VGAQLSMQAEPHPTTPRQVLVRVYGDSLGMPRATAGIDYRDTYAERLKEEIEKRTPGRRVSMYNRSRGGAAISTLFADFKTDSFFFGQHGGTLLILQAGVVDCAPRPISPFLRRGVGMLPTAPRQRVVKLLHDHRASILRKGIAWRETKPRVFATAYAEWLSVATAAFEWVYVMNIAPTIPAIEKRSPGFGDSVTYYNGIIEQVVRANGAGNVRLVDVHSAIQRDNGASRFINQQDGHHITADGHKLYADLVAATLARDNVLGFGTLQEKYT
jgi:lysophospholipase L1-like esterase